MSFFYPQKLVELAIRIGANDVISDRNVLESLFKLHTYEGEGAVLSNPEDKVSVRERLVTDEFQKMIKELPRIENDKSSDLFEDHVNFIDIEKYFRDKNRKLRIVHGFPKSPDMLPCISITMGNDDESTQFLGTQKGRLRDNQGNAYRVIGSNWGQQLMISIMSDSYDEIVIWHKVIKRALTVYRLHLEAYGMSSQSLSFQDIEPANEYLQSGLFVFQRSGILSYEAIEDVVVRDSSTFDSIEFNINGVDEDSDGTIIPDKEP